MTLHDQLADVVVTTISMGRPMNDRANRLSLEEAFDVADKVTKRIEKPMGGVGGYKIAWNTDAQMEAFSLPHPGMGRVFNKYIRANGAAVALTDFHELMIEVEIVAVLGETLPLGTVHTPQTMKEAIDYFTVGFEILNRSDGADDASPHSIIAHNVFNAGAVMGSIHIPPDELDTSTITTRMAVDGSVVFEDVGKAPQDPFEAAAFLANHFAARGVEMKAGQIILCGSHIPLYPVKEPCELSVSMSNLGDVSFTVV